jgi:hypothetical protein
MSLRRLLWRGLRRSLWHIGGLWRAPWWLLWRLLWRVSHLRAEDVYRLPDAVHGVDKPLEGVEDRAKVAGGLWRGLRRVPWCGLWHVGTEVACRKQRLTAEAVLRIEVQAAGMDGPLQGAAVTVAEACRFRNGPGLGHGQVLSVSRVPSAWSAHHLQHVPRP